MKVFYEINKILFLRKLNRRLNLMHHVASYVKLISHVARGCISWNLFSLFFLGCTCYFMTCTITDYFFHINPEKNVLISGTPHLHKFIGSGHVDIEVEQEWGIRRFDIYVLTFPSSFCHLDYKGPSDYHLSRVICLSRWKKTAVWILHRTYSDISQHDKQVIRSFLYLFSNEYITDNDMFEQMSMYKRKNIFPDPL